MSETETTLAARGDQRRARFEALLAELERRNLSGFLVPLADRHQGEYIPPSEQRLAWLTGFTGSAGLAVAHHPAAIFIDGRYTLQAADQVDTALFTPLQVPEEKPEQWLQNTLAKGARLGYDPWLHTPAQLKKLRAGVEAAGAELVAVEDNPVDAVWHDRPAAPQAQVVPHPLQYAGVSAADKRARIGQALAAKQLDAAVLTLPDSIAWLLNVRGGDVQRSPLPLAFAVIAADGGVELFIDPQKIGPELGQHLGNGVTVRQPQDFGAALDKLGAADAKVALDPTSAAAWINDRLSRAGAKVHPQDDPCLLPKACKNPTELAGTRAAHRRDGAALSRFLHWLDARIEAGEEVDELGAEAQLEAFRRATGELRDLSFDTISGAGPNGAVVHYRVSADSNRPLSPGSLYLVDSGGQYLDGTTDVTRTVAVGQPTAEQRDRFTRVLKGHIALARVRFPAGTSGSQLDVLARTALWQVGLDYDHGTGHGVGSYLCVHEGPQRISKVPNSVALQPGMVISNEPGYYKTDEYGIRIENLVTVTEPEDLPGGERPMLAFETLTLAPIDRRLIDVNLLTPGERDWLNGYHARVREVIGAELDGDVRAWLTAATAPL